MAKNNSADDKRNRARENARQIAANQAKKEKTAKTILYTGIAVVVVAVLAVVSVLVIQQNKPAVSPSNYVADGITAAKDNTLVQPLKMPEGEESDLRLRPKRVRRRGPPRSPSTSTSSAPARKAFEEGNSKMLRKLADEGSIVINYKPVSFLDRMSSGNEYSTRSANLAACVIDSQPEVAVDLFDALFAQQPEEGADGRTDAELLKVAEKAGVDTSKKLKADPEQTVKSCVTDRTFDKFVEESSQNALDDGVEATPWVLVNGKHTDKTSDPQALATEILKATGEFKG